MAAADIQEQYATAPGNWLAQEIRRFQEQSTGLFPSPKPGDEKIRYNTIYGLEYAPLANEAYKTDTPMLLKRPGVKKETPFSLEQAKRFNTWKVRKDLVDVDRVQQRVAERRRTALEAANRQQDDKINLPTIGRVCTVGGDIRGDFPTPSLSRARPAVAQSVCGSIREGRQMDSRHSLPAGIALQSQDRYKNIKADLVEAAEDYLQKNPQSDRRVIDKALRSSTAPADEPKRKSQPANTKQEVAKWLEQATDEEQEIALHFFRSVGGMRLMGTGGKPEMNTRHQTLLSALETGEAGNPHLPRLSYRDEQKRRERKQRNLQFVRLLSPKTLNNRQELQSWHHLPAYRQANRADNVRSHYTQPQKVRPLHFTIHPDWGP